MAYLIMDHGASVPTVVGWCESEEEAERVCEAWVRRGAYFSIVRVPRALEPTEGQR